MKRFYKNTFMSRTFSNALRVVALLCVLLGVSSAAWAETGFYQSSNYYNAALSVRFNKEVNGSDWHNYKIYGEGETALGDLTKKLKLEEFYYRTYNTDGDAVCADGSQIEFYIDGAETPQTEPVVWSSDLNKDGNKYPKEWKNKNATCNIDFPTTVGKHEIYVKVKAKVGNDCSGTICLTNQDGGKCDGGGYYITYNVPAKIYVYGGAVDNQYSPCEITAENNVVRYKLDHYNSWIKISDQKSENLDNFYKKTSYLYHTNECSDSEKTSAFAAKGAHIQKHKSWEGGSLEDIIINRDAGYSEPVYFYYNTSTKKYWVEASQKAAYRIEFEDGTSFGCTDLDKGTACVNSLDLGEGTYRFKVYKNNVAYYYKANSSKITNTLSKTALTQGDQYTTLVVDNYGTLTFTMQESGSNFNLTVGYQKLEEPVLLGAKAVLASDQKSATLSAYLQGSLCTNQAIADYGFYLCSGTGCSPDKDSYIKILRPTTSDLFRGDDFSYTASVSAPDNLIGGVTYGYRAYVTIDGKTYLSRETGYFTLQDDCSQQTAGGDPVVFTIDASLGEDFENPCKLIYGSLQNAMYKLRDSYNNEEIYQYVKLNTSGGHSSYDLQQPVIFNIKYYDDTPNDQSKAYCYQGDKKAEVSGGGGDSEQSLALIFKDFNRSNTKDYTLTIQGASGTNRPWLHHVILRNSRNIVLDNLAIFSDPTGKRQDDALEFDVNTMSWNTIEVGKCANANIVVKNCMIGSNGFTGLHASGYDGITFENNEFEAIMATTGDVGNAVAWGASAKFMFCKNIKFVRNNFRGAHATLIWFQDSQNALFMNNVFWNTNQYNANCAAIRLVNQYGGKVVQNTAFLYNTFYLQNNAENANGYDFLHTSVKENDGDKFNNIKFQYNNCYSYDTDIPGKYSSPDLTNSDVCPNNFWSIKSDADFSFGDCKDAVSVTMEGLICETSATGPSSLVIRGGGELNNGKNLTAADFTTGGTYASIGIPMTDEELTYDRYNQGARPNTDSWTYGAYQGKEGVEVNTIYWVGLTDNWDDRNNWVYFTDNNSVQGQSVAQERGMVMQRLSCINKLSEYLKVIIPEKPLVQGSGAFSWPQIPDEFDAGKRKTKYGIPTGEQVTAGLGYDGKLEKFADNIELEYGAAIKGVEHLTNGEVHYGSATMNFTAPRYKWILVGTVVKPFDSKGNPRNVVSGDYYIQGQNPHVYMHNVELDGDTYSWTVPFSSLEEEVEPNTAFAIQIPDQYGKYKLPASYSNKKYGTSYNPDEEIVYGTYPGTTGPFTGKFVNDNGNNPIVYTVKSGWNILSNSYPCNIDAREIKTGNIKFFDNESCTFMDLGSVPDDQEVLLKPQQGFLYKATSAGTLTITSNMLTGGNTRSRSVAVSLPTISLNLYNANTNVQKSNVVVKYDELLEKGTISENDVDKVFTGIAEAPELYIIANDGKYSVYNTPSTEQAIPLGIRVKQSMNVRFEKAWFKEFSKVILVDMLKGVECDLLEMPYTTETLSTGDLEGRFFLYLEEVTTEDDTEGDDNVSTEVEDYFDADAINIFVEESDNTISIITNGVELETIYVSDMAGKTISYKASGFSTSLKLPVPKGVYLVQVIGDTANRTEKVILK